MLIAASFFWLVCRYLLGGGGIQASRVQVRFLVYMPQSSWTPADLPEQTIALLPCWLPLLLKRRHPRSVFFEAVSTLGVLRSPLRPADFSVYASQMLFHRPLPLLQSSRFDLLYQGHSLLAI
ncbi:MAG: hypothetical protein AAGJ81_15135 [Verrucomicrobiota bacterium]